MLVFEGRQTLGQRRTGITIEVPEGRRYRGDRFPYAVAGVRARVGWQQLRRLTNMRTHIGDGRLCPAHHFAGLGAVGERDEVLGDEAVGASLRLEDAVEHLEPLLAYGRDRGRE